MAGARIEDVLSYPEKFDILKQFVQGVTSLMVRRGGRISKRLQGGTEALVDADRARDLRQTGPSTRAQLDAAADGLARVVDEVLNKRVARTRPSSSAKRWWTYELRRCGTR